MYHAVVIYVEPCGKGCKVALGSLVHRIFPEISWKGVGRLWSSEEVFTIGQIFGRPRF